MPDMKEVSRESFLKKDYTSAEVTKIYRLMANVAKQMKDGRRVSMEEKTDRWIIIVWKPKDK
jgi:hypothetical protein